jgi:hypothetical protein
MNATDTQLKHIFATVAATLTPEQADTLIAGLQSADRKVAEEWALKLVMLYQVATNAKVKAAIVDMFY